MNQPQIKCPRCGTLNPKTVDACIACGFARSNKKILKPKTPSNKNITNNISNSNIQANIYKKNQIRGVVGGLVTRNESGLNVFSFRVDQYDHSSGNLMRSYPVNMIGEHFLGHIENGNIVEFKGRLTSEGYKVKKIWNITTLSEFKIKGRYTLKPLWIFLFIVFLWLGLGFLFESLDKKEFPLTGLTILLVDALLLLIPIVVSNIRKKRDRKAHFEKFQNSGVVSP